MHDVFISYEHESKSIADNICSVLERNKIRCWYAPRDVIGDYATSIVDAISNTKIFVLILNENSSNSRHVLNEVEIAYKIENNLTIIPFKVDNKTLSMAMEYYVKRLHWIDASDRSLDIAIDDLMKKISSILGIDVEHKEPKQIDRIQNKYFTNSDGKEKARLRTQALLLKNFDQEVYNSVMVRDGMTVLDLGSNNGDLVMDRIGGRQEVKVLVGLEYDADSVVVANEIHGSENPLIKFYQCDLESPDFNKQLSDIASECGVVSFDIINISMVLLHLNNPYKVVRVVRKFLADDGVMIIRDIDDGINYAYPDPEGNFDRVYRICRDNETSGYRHSGRQIYSILRKCGLENIKLERAGLNSIGMCYSDKQALFDTYFSFIILCI